METMFHLPDAVRTQEPTIEVAISSWRQIDVGFGRAGILERPNGHPRDSAL
jgi:hypothetical protein